METLSLIDTLYFIKEISNFKWLKTSSTLSICTSNNKIYLWNNSNMDFIEYKCEGM